MELNDSYHSLLAQYAAGSLDEAHALIVAAHISLSARGRNYVAHCERMGGRLLVDYCTPEPMATDAFSQLWSRIEIYEREACASGEGPCRDKSDFPSCVDAYVKQCTAQRWKTGRRGLHILALPVACRESRAHMLRVEPKTAVRIDVVQTPKTVLVLCGGLTTGSLSLASGDMMVFERKGRHDLNGVDASNTCLIVSGKPSLAEKIRNLLFR